MSNPPVREAKPLAQWNAATVLAAVAEDYELEAGALVRRDDRHSARAMAASLCRRHTLATLPPAHTGDASRDRRPVGSLACRPCAGPHPCAGGAVEDLGALA